MRMRHFLAMAGALAAITLAVPAPADFIKTDIMSIQDTSSVLRDTLTAADTVCVQGVITGADEEGSGKGFYIEDPSGTLFRGILVFTGGANTFADSGLARGDRVEVIGRVTEFSGGTEIISRSGSAFGSPPVVNFIGSEAIPGPTIVSVTEVAYNGAIAEWYEGMFVKMNGDIRVIAVPPDSGLFSNNFLAEDASPPPNEHIIVDMTTLADPPLPVPPVTSVITFCQGIFDQRNQYRVQARDAADILLPVPPDLVSAHAVDDNTIRVQFNLPMDPTTAEDVGNYSRGTLKFIDSATLQGDMQTVYLDCTTDPQVSPELEEVFVSGVESAAGGVMVGTQSLSFIAGLTPLTEIQTPPSGQEYITSTGSDTSQFYQQVVTTRGTVTARDGNLLWVQDPAGGLRSGIKFFAPSIGMNVGDDVTVTGFPIEFFDETEFSGAIWEQNNGAGVMPAAVVPATLAELNALSGPPAREDYEHILVQLDDVAVSVTGGCFGDWVVKSGGACYTNPACGDSATVSTLLNSNYAYSPTVGDMFSSLTGVIQVSNPGGSCYYALRIVPRTDSDFVMGNVVDADPAPFAFALRVPQPNPISFSRGGTVAISFTLPTEGEASLALYDIRGRRVRQLVGGTTLEAGPHTLRWDGRDAGGVRLGSGIYFVQLKLGNAVAATKLVVAE